MLNYTVKSRHIIFIFRFQYFHEKIRNYECSYCEKKFQAKKLLYNHVQSIHLGEKTNCPDCKKDISVDNFSRHVRETHERVSWYCKEGLVTV